MVLLFPGLCGNHDSRPHYQRSAGLMIKEAQHRGGLAWMNYDKAFRHQLAPDPSIPWNTINPSLLASTILHGLPLIKPKCVLFPMPCSRPHTGAVCPRLLEPPCLSSCRSALSITGLELSHRSALSGTRAIAHMLAGAPDCSQAPLATSRSDQPGSAPPHLLHAVVGGAVTTLSTS